MSIFGRVLIVAVVLVPALYASAVAQEVAPASSGGEAQRAIQPPPVAASSGILVESGTGKILWAKGDETPRPPASLTKMLTALVVLERTKLNDKVVITRDARYVDGARIYADEGWTFTALDLLWGLLLQSGNDAAVALAQDASPDGGVEGFVTLMNDRAAQLGAKQSTFKNPHGLDEVGHLASARDLALIATAAMKHEIFAGIVSSKTHEIKWGDGSVRTFININKLLSRYEGTIGIKTAYTTEAGRGLASAVKREDATLLAVVLDSPDHYAESIALYNWGFANLGVLSGRPLGVIRPVTRKSSTKDEAVEGLEVVQYDPGAEKDRNDDPAPLAVPILVLFGVIVAGRWLRRILRPKSSFESIDEFNQTLDVLSAQALREPERIDA